MASCDDFPRHQVPMCSRSLRIAVIMHSIANTAFFTVHGTMSVTHQPQLGGTSADFNRFRMHPDDYATSWQEKCTVLSQQCSRRQTTMKAKIRLFPAKGLLSA